MSNFQIIDQERLNRSVVNGADIGIQAFVLARTSDRLLLYAPGHSFYAGRMTGSLYAPSALWMFKRREDSFRMKAMVKIAKGGRFNQKRLDTLGPEIDAAMGEEGGWYKLLEWGKTLVVGDNGPFSSAGFEYKL